jgi:hypothetical protein
VNIGSPFHTPLTPRIVIQNTTHYVSAAKLMKSKEIEAPKNFAVSIPDMCTVEAVSWV